MTLTFEEATHTYRVDGRVVLSVTQILTLAGMGVDYRNVAPAVLAHARARGQHVDECIDLLDAGDLDWGSVHPEAVPYVRAWQSFCEQEAFHTVYPQEQLYHRPTETCDEYAGTVDAIGQTPRVEGLIVVERKCTAKLAETYALQTAAYAFAIANPFEDIPARWLVQLLPTGRYKLVDHDAEAARLGRDDFSAWRAAVQVARWRVASQNGSAGTPAR